MFTYVKLKNFMSFKNAEFNFKRGKRDVKKFAVIYGENGSGKSNFVNSISFLRKSIDSFAMTVNMDKISELRERGIPEAVVDLIQMNSSILSQAASCRMVENEEETSIIYGFEVNGHEGYYCLSFSERFTHEKLYYFTGKQSGKLFEISVEDGRLKIFFSEKIFLNKIKADMEEEIRKFWGKHTFLGILEKERHEKNEEYIRANYLGYLFDFSDMLKETTVHYKKSNRSGSEYIDQNPVNLLNNLQEGKIHTEQAFLLDHSEHILKDFFTQAYADIKDVYFERTAENGIIHYKLFVKKMIGGKVRSIDFSNESAGTQHILEIIRSLLGAFCGVTVVYDEIDNGIHDLLLKNVLSSMLDDITGQLIITTHNTYLLESVNVKSVYVITVDYMGNKTVKCLDEYPRIQGSNNPRIMYLKGLFGGVPIVDSLDYDLIISELNEKKRGDNE